MGGVDHPRIHLELDFFLFFFYCFTMALIGSAIKRKRISRGSLDECIPDTHIHHPRSLPHKNWNDDDDVQNPNKIKSMVIPYVQKNKKKKNTLK